MTTVKTEGFQYPQPRSRPDFRRPFSDGSMTIATEDLAASLPTTSQFLTHFPYDHQPFINPYAFHNHPVPTESQPSSQVLVDERSRSLSRGSIGKAPRSRSGRKGSMNDTKPVMPRIRTASNRAMSYSHPDGRLGLGLDTHLEGERTNSISPPDFTFGIAPNGWTGSGSLPSMQSFGTTIDEAILDSPFSPTFNLPGLPFDANEESKKQRRRECHNQVEKRRREHINTKIDELSQLLPPQYQQVEEALDEEEDEADADSPKKRKNRRNSAAKQKDLARCKGRILTHSVQYIHDLRHVNTLQATRIQQLESMLAGTSFASQSVFQPQSTIMLEQRGLEVMQPSPEPENFMQASWNTFNPVFEPSPDSFNTASTSGTSGPSIDDSHTNGRSKPAHTRHDSQMSIQMGMTDMDLDSVFAARREDDSVLRW